MGVAVTGFLVFAASQVGTPGPANMVLLATGQVQSDGSATIVVVLHSENSFDREGEITRVAAVAVDKDEVGCAFLGSPGG